MKLFLDTADIEAIRRAARLGVVDGITTNPTLLAKSGRGDYKQVVQEICHIVHGPVSAETVSTDVDGMMEEAREIATWSPYVLAKIPISEAGLEAITRLTHEPRPERINADNVWAERCEQCRDLSRIPGSSRGVPINTTLIFSANQALLAAKAGATYVSPFVGRLDDAGLDGMEVVRDTVEIFRAYGIQTAVLAASLRHSMHVLEAARAGADIATMPPEVLLQLIKHPFTDAGLARFLKDWQSLQGARIGDVAVEPARR